MTAETPLPRIGAHVGTSGGLPAILERARTLRVQAIQFFPSNPRTWRATLYPSADVAAFAEAIKAADLHVFLHTIYLVNLASPDEGLRERSAAAVAQALAFGAAIGSAGVVTHVGSHKGDGFETALNRTTRALHRAHTLAREALDGPTAELPPLLLETSAGQANSMGRTPAELGRLLATVERPAGVCLDTAHLFVAGYAIGSPAGLDDYLAGLAGHVGLDRVGLIHLNDARKPLGSGLDQHENLGEGTIGREGLALFLTHPAFRHVPFVLEVPGFAGHGPDRRNLARAKAWRRRGLGPDAHH